MPVTDSEKISVIHDEVFNLDVGVLVNFVFFVNCHPFPVADSKFGNRVDWLFILELAMLRQQLSPFSCCHFDVLLRFGFGMSYL